MSEDPNSSLAWLADHSVGGSSARLSAALLEALKEPQHARLDLFYYAASVSGWNLIAPAVKEWRSAKAGRNVRAWIGLDDAATDPEALRKMRDAGLNVHVPRRYSGTFHPKLILFRGARGGRVLAGSHNLSTSAFSRNFEVSVNVPFTADPPSGLADWIATVEEASDELTDALLKSYEKERNSYRKKQPSAFTWSGRQAAPKRAGPPLVAAPRGALIMEIMPLETGADGKQIQPPMDTLTPFFGLPEGKPVSKLVRARLKGAPNYEDRTIARNPNSTGRAHIPELDYSDRPCFMIFTKSRSGFEYEIVSQATEPGRYAALATVAVNQTNPNTRRWAIVSQDIIA